MDRHKRCRMYLRGCRKVATNTVVIGSHVYRSCSDHEPKRK